ncbi:MAG TPA: FtsX-like permease family protein [Chitinophagaceae bacterium]|nr:FtsX-like permease family protein [Chitinophagaceae bacterium]
MLKNYFKIAIAVLKRRKFFTFISLFGISFTLAIIIVVTAFIDHAVRPGYPDVNRDRELYADRMHLKSSKNQSNINGGPSFYFVNHYVANLKTPVKVSIQSNGSATNSYVNNKKLVNRLRYTNDQFWQVLQFNFIEGKPYNKQQVDNAEKVAVISEDMRNAYFGEDAKALGKYIETDNVQYRIIGVVTSLPATSNVFADIYVPYTLSKEDLHNTGLIGGYRAIMLFNSRDDFKRARDEYNQMVAKLPRDPQFDLVYTYADTYPETFTRGLPFAEGEDAGVTTFLIIATIIILLFLLLPTLNLVNINISRIIDRSSEIGVRKAFGASSRTLVYQFIVENLILTFLGGIVGIVLSFIILQIINNAGLVDHMHLAINLHVLFITLLACIFFGLLSGVYPAWRMSRMHVVTALKAQ